MTSDIFEQIVKKALFGTSVFKDETKLFREYIPNRLPRREKELERISRDFRPILKDKSNFPVNIALSGKSGVGKTVVAKYFCEKLTNYSKSLEKKIEYQYCNCYTYRTRSALLYHLLSKLYKATCRGFEPETLLLDLHNRLKRDNKKLVLILDEVHVLKDEVLFFLQLSDPNIYYILISRDYFFKQMLNVNLSGRINDHIKLDGYSKEDLIEILNFRTEEAFKQGSISSQIIELIANIA
ncbi:MAG: AAA family ATPase, partial [Candidatus Helarchaeota archaeon]|nr:AAA family ATPase [Candidatus Helarchaeota archaeon]